MYLGHLGRLVLSQLILTTSHATCAIFSSLTQAELVHGCLPKMGQLKCRPTLALESCILCVLGTKNIQLITISLLTFPNRGDDQSIELRTAILYWQLTLVFL